VPDSLAALVKKSIYTPVF